MFYFKTGSARKSQVLVQSLLLSLAMMASQGGFAQTGALAATGATESQAVPTAGDQVRVNINEADAATIADVLVGIGTSRAMAIVEYREQHGRFTSLEDLVEVTGVGEATVFNNKDRIRFE